MSLKHPWLILQMVPLVLSAPTSTDKVPALPRLSPTASRDVLGANLWNWKTSVTSPREEDKKPRPLQRHLTGSGGTTAAMSLKHAWLILQMVPLVLSVGLARKSQEHTIEGTTTTKQVCGRGKAAIISDRGTGVNISLTAAHEISHALGANHDGEGSSQSCPPIENRLMFPHAGGIGPNYSPCSLQEINIFLNSPKATCLFPTGYTSPSQTNAKP
ncbi:hypothetical protein MRX96_041427 [Rhipicephalus microplus]